MTLRRYTPLRNRTPLKERNPARRAQAFERRFGTHAAFIRSRPCIVISDGRPDRRSPCQGRMVAAHVHHAGIGGAKGDKRDLVPCCWAHHEQLDGRALLPDGGVGMSAFAAFFRIEDLDAVAARLWAENPEN